MFQVVLFNNAARQENATKQPILFTIIGSFYTFFIDQTMAQVWPKGQDLSCFYQTETSGVGCGDTAAVLNSGLPLPE